jgi:segregation and condensation protein B
VTERTSDAALSNGQPSESEHSESAFPEPALSQLEQSGNAPSEAEQAQLDRSETERLEAEFAVDDEMASDGVLDSALEALLLVVDEPADVGTLAAAVDQPTERVLAALRRLTTRYRDGDRGIDLRHVGGGWRFYTRDRYAPYVERMLRDGQRAKLTRAALETLAVVAYRQPVTRARVSAVRGVNCDGVIRTLLTRGLVEETGVDPQTQGILYRTTELFLERLGLSSLAELPPLAPLLPEVDAIDDV